MANPRETLVTPAAGSHPSRLMGGTRTLYTTSRGAAFVGDSLALMQRLPDHSVDLVVTSPPYALHFKKEYGNVAKDLYVDWFVPFGRDVPPQLKCDSSPLHTMEQGGADASSERSQAPAVHA